MGSTTTTPKSDLEIYQALRIEALEKELLKAKELLTEMQTDIQNCINGIEVIYEPNL
jgi:hypothetical protein